MQLYPGMRTMVGEKYHLISNVRYNHIAANCRNKLIRYEAVTKKNNNITDNKYNYATRQPRTSLQVPVMSCVRRGNTKEWKRKTAELNLSEASGLPGNAPKYTVENCGHANDTAAPYTRCAASPAIFHSPCS